MDCPLCLRVEETKNGKYPFLITEFKNSYLYLGEHQFYRGYCILVTKQHFREMIDLPIEQRNELFSEMMMTQDLIQRVFNPKKMNLCSLGNVVDHIHWHFFPRYADDLNFKNPPWLQMHLFDDAKVNIQQMNELIRKLRAEIKLL